MGDDPKQQIESYVTTALRARLEEAARATSAFREDLMAAVARLEAAVKAAGDKTFDLPAELLPALPPPAPPPAAEVGLLSHILASQKDLLEAADQVGLLTQLLLGCTVSCPRVAFFIVKKDAFGGWATRGFERAQEADVRSLSVPIADDTILGAAYRSGYPVRSGPGRFSQDTRFLKSLGSAPAADTLAVPIWIRDKISAVLYGDSGQDDHITDPEVPEILALHAGLCLETLATRQKFPRPKPGEAPAAAAAGVQPPPSAQPAAGFPSGPISIMGMPVAAAEAAVPAAPPAVAAPRPVTGPQPAQSPVAQASSPPAPPVPAAAQAAAKSAPAAPSLDHLPEDERKLHEEARRFARLLVSEIVLYNERQVEEGRRQKDLYERLKEDIDRSLGMYQQRISPKVRSSSNYFYQELVRTLANGDESAIKVPWA